ncbi:MAG: hypothetical protein M3169_03800 [Candidatus Eremiobacteraeota bacterium]|nr:hypothetical protein [Candidatus Eremiobacteraeota bacterium]
MTQTLFARVTATAVLCVVSAAACYATAAAKAPPASRYVVHQLAMPADSVLSANDIARYGPRAIALATNGAVAAVVEDRGRTFLSRRIVVWRADGSRVTIGMPDDTVLHEAFRHYTGGPVPYPQSSFSHVVLAGDGTPFATVSNGFSGAYSGTDQGVFRWAGAAWKLVRAAGQNGSMVPTDFDVVAAELPALRIGMTGDYSGGFVQIDALEHDPAYQLPEALLYDGTTVRSLGTGTMTALAGTYACGFIGEQNGRTMPDNVNVDGQIPYALLFHDGVTKRLGRGVAFGVNASGVAVGDDRISVNGGSITTIRTATSTQVIARNGLPNGMPVRWDPRGATALGRKPGTAFAIAADGTIVGAFARGGGFVAHDRALTALDALVPGSHAHIRGAYAINAHGRILVLTGFNGTPGLAYLDPAS